MAGWSGFFGWRSRDKRVQPGLRSSDPEVIPAGGEPSEAPHVPGLVIRARRAGQPASSPVPGGTP